MAGQVQTCSWRLLAFRDVRGDDLRLATYLRIEEREPDAGWLNETVDVAAVPTQRKPAAERQEVGGCRAARHDWPCKTPHGN